MQWRTRACKCMPTSFSDFLHMRAVCGERCRTMSLRAATLVASADRLAPRPAHPSVHLPGRPRPPEGADPLARPSARPCPEKTQTRSMVSFAGACQIGLAHTPAGHPAKALQGPGEGRSPRRGREGECRFPSTGSHASATDRASCSQRAWPTRATDNSRRPRKVWVSRNVGRGASRKAGPWQPMDK